MAKRGRVSGRKRGIGGSVAPGGLHASMVPVIVQCAALALGMFAVPERARAFGDAVVGAHPAAVHRAPFGPDAR